MKYLLLFGICISFTAQVYGQGCGVSGSLVPAAVLVDPSCGPTVFVKDSVPACSTGFALPPVCSAAGTSYTNKDPNWYHFFCLKSGTLRFIITPENSLDDYNWMLLDVTGHSWRPDVLKNPSNVVGGNWSGKGGKTGASTYWRIYFGLPYDYSQSSISVSIQYNASSQRKTFLSIAG